MSLETKLRESLDQAAGQVRLPAGDLDVVRRRGRRRRLFRRATVGTGGATLVVTVVLAAVGVLHSWHWLDILDGPPSASSVASALPAEWQSVEVGAASFGVPVRWARVDVAPGERMCTNMAEVPTVYVASGGMSLEGPCPARGYTVPVLVAMPLSELSEGWVRPGTSPDDTASTVTVNDHTGIRLNSVAEFEALDLYLAYYRAQDDGPTFDTILAGVAATDQQRSDSTIQDLDPDSACVRWRDAKRYRASENDWLANDLAQMQLGHARSIITATPGLHEGFVDDRTRSIVHLVDTTVLDLADARRIVEEGMREAPTADDLRPDRANRLPPVPLRVELAAMCVPAQILFDTRSELALFLDERAMLTEPRTDGAEPDPGFGPVWWTISDGLDAGAVIITGNLTQELVDALHARFGDLVTVERSYDGPQVDFRS